MRWSPIQGLKLCSLDKIQYIGKDSLTNELPMKSGTTSMKIFKKKVDITYKGSEIRCKIVTFIEDNAVVVVVGIFPVLNLIYVFVTNQPFNLLTASQKPSRTRKKRHTEI